MSEIIKIDYSDEMKTAYIDYAMSVIISRALPDVRDGLKPVHRRILFAMKDLKLMPSINSDGEINYKKFKKSARIVGDVLGKYHPHGDQSVYNAMVLLAQDFKAHMPLVKGEGNFGSIDGDSPSAMRYSEATLEGLSTELLKDMEKDVVDFTENFDGTLKEPVVLPAKFPNLLVNGAEGIAVGMSTVIPSHNLGEVINATIKVIDSPNVRISTLVKHDIIAPDFPTGGIIANKENMLNIYKKGKGRVRIRGKVEIEDSSYGRTNIVIKEIPYTVSGNIEGFLDRIIAKAKKGQMNELYDIRNESGRGDLRIVLEVNRDVDIDNFLLKLYKKTSLEDSINVNMLALVDGEPKQLNLKEILEHFIKFQRELNTKKFNHLLKKAETRKEIVEGLKIAYDEVDTIIQTIRGAKSLEQVKDCLITGKVKGIKFRTKTAENRAKKFNFTELQADSIVKIRLGKLVGLELNKLEEEFKVLEKEIKQYKKYLSSDKEMNEFIKSELRDVRNKYATPRKTEVDDIELKVYEKKVVIDDVHVLIDKFNYLKMVDDASYTRANDETIDNFIYDIKAKSNDKIGIFTESGYFYQIKLEDIEKSKMNDRGVPISRLIESKNEQILFLKLVRDMMDKDLFFLTGKGYAKIVKSEEFETNYSKIKALNLGKADDLIAVKSVNPNKLDYIGFLTKENYAMKINSRDIPEKSRATKGSKTIKFSKKGDRIIVGDVFNDKPHILKYKGKEYDISDMYAKKRLLTGNKL